MAADERTLLDAIAGIEAAGGVAHSQAVAQSSGLRTDEIDRIAKALIDRGYLSRAYADRADQRAETLGPRYLVTVAGRRQLDSPPT
ncbi:MAG: hypothetical protein M3N52_01810 [Actinomycetota bacterium]|nr:hypothetical protein [Actinomycetota bacterium]